MKFNFCPDCETCLIVDILNNENPNNILSYKCKNCGYKLVVDLLKNPEHKCVYKHTYNLNKTNIDKNNIKYLDQDPTLPHVNNIQCMNVNCITNKQLTNLELVNNDNDNVNINNVLYIMTNESNLTFLYQCCNCNHTWTNK